MLGRNQKEHTDRKESRYTDRLSGSAAIVRLGCWWNLEIGACVWWRMSIEERELLSDYAK